MTDVLIVCVREDEVQAKALADMFERAGFSVGGAPADDSALRGCAAVVVLWSQASIRSRPFLDAAQRVVNAGKAVVACLIDPPPSSSLNQSPAFDLRGWAGDPEDPALDPLFFAVDRMAQAAGVTPLAQAAPHHPLDFTPPAREPAPPTPLRARPMAQSRYDSAAPAYAPPPAEPARAPRRPAAPPAEMQDAMSAEALRWRAIRHSRDPAAFLHYLAEYGPDGAFSELAELRLKQLQDSNATPLKAAARAVDQTQRRQPTAQAAPVRREPPPAQRIEPRPQPRPEPRYEERYQPRAERAPERVVEPFPEPRREYRDYEPERRRTAGGGGAARFLILFLVLGAAAVGAGMYFGQGARLPSNSSAATEQPAAAETASVDEGQAAAAPPADEDRTAIGGPTPREEAAFDRPDPPRPAAQQARAPAFRPVEPDPPQTPPLMPQMAPQPQQVASLETPPQIPTIARPGVVLWANRASAAQYDAAYPTRARDAGIDGRVQLRCHISGALQPECAVVSETPSGYGFGAAALRLTRSYRAQPALDNGAAAAGAEANIVMQFRTAP